MLPKEFKDEKIGAGSSILKKQLNVSKTSTHNSVNIIDMILKKHHSKLQQARVTLKSSKSIVVKEKSKEIIENEEDLVFENS